MTLTVGSLFSGVGGLEKGFEDAGFELVFQVEKERSCQEVLRAHWPDVQLYDDVTEVTYERLRADLGDRAAVDVLVGGWPCQNISVAGDRSGLAGERSGLFFEFARLIGEIRPRWLVAENVAGLLSSYSPAVDAFSDVPPGIIDFDVVETYDFGTVINALSELGYVGAWRVLDARHFGVPQRRRRVFIVGHLGEPFDAPAQVLFESQVSSRNPETSNEEEPFDATEVAESLGDSGSSGIEAVGVGSQVGEVLGAIPPPGGRSIGALVMGTERMLVGDQFEDSCARTLTAPVNGQRVDLETENFVVEGKAETFRKSHRAREAGGSEKWVPADHANTLTGHDHSVTRTVHAVVSGVEVRRLTPMEYERLQGFPDGWTGVTGLADSTRYRQVGNSVAVPVARWIAERLRNVDATLPRV